MPDASSVAVTRVTVLMARVVLLLSMVLLVSCLFQFLALGKKSQITGKQHTTPSLNAVATSMVNNISKLLAFSIKLVFACSYCLRVLLCVFHCTMHKLYEADGLDSYSTRGPAVTYNIPCFLCKKKNYSKRR